MSSTRFDVETNLNLSFAENVQQSWHSSAYDVSDDETRSQNSSIEYSRRQSLRALPAGSDNHYVQCSSRSNSARTPVKTPRKICLRSPRSRHRMVANYVRTSLVLSPSDLKMNRLLKSPNYSATAGFRKRLRDKHEEFISKLLNDSGIDSPESQTLSTSASSSSSSTKSLTTSSSISNSSAGNNQEFNQKDSATPNTSTTRVNSARRRFRF